MKWTIWLVALATLILSTGKSRADVNFAVGHFYATNDSSIRIKEYDSNGTLLGFLPVSGVTDLHGLAFGPDHLLYAVSGHSLATFDVLALSTFGFAFNVEQSYSSGGGAYGGPPAAGKIVFDQHNHFYVSNYRFDIGDANSVQQFYFGSEPLLDEVVLPSGNLLGIDRSHLYELTPSGSIVRTISGSSQFDFADLRGVAFDQSTNSIYVDQLGTTAPQTPQGIARLDFTTGAFINRISFAGPNDLWLTNDGRLIAASMQGNPGIFTKDLQQQLGTFTGNSENFVTQLIPVPEPSSWSLLLAAGAGLLAFARQRALATRVVGLADRSETLKQWTIARVAQPWETRSC